MSCKMGRYDDSILLEEVESIELVELRELQDMVDEGYPSDKQLERYEELARKWDPDRLNVHLDLEKESPQAEAITRWEHEDRVLDDRMANSIYDGNEEDESRFYMNMGKSVSYSTSNFRWIKTPSPFKKGNKEYNRKVYVYLKEVLDQRTWKKISGITGKKTVVNYLQAWIEIPEFMKAGSPSLAKYLTVFVFGKIVNDYRESLVQHFPVHFKRSVHEDSIYNKN